MSVNTHPAGDTSTQNGNWGTLVIVLVVAIIAIMVALFATHQPASTQAVPMLINGSSAPNTVAAPAAPASSDAPGASPSMNTAPNATSPANSVPATPGSGA